MQQRAFKQVDVFTAAAYLGNPLAVVLDGSDLDDAAMQSFARWTNLSETTFVLPPLDAAADYRLRIFTPGGELPFAGHPTLGSCHSWLEAGGQPQHSDFIIQQCSVGLIKIRRGLAEQALAFAAPALKQSSPSQLQLTQAAAALGLEMAQILSAQILDNGPVWFSLLLDSPETVLQISPNHAELQRLNLKIGVAAIYKKEVAPALIARINREARAFGQRTANAQAEPDLEVRAFAACIGIDEDPVTGSLNASLAQWLMAEGRMPDSYTAAQGCCLGRAGQVSLQRDGQGQVWVGGQTVTCISGSVLL
jgi:PhzF family phenazine biosynthesis protein